MVRINRYVRIYIYIERERGREGDRYRLKGWAVPWNALALVLSLDLKNCSRGAPGDLSC